METEETLEYFCKHNLHYNNIAEVKNDSSICLISLVQNPMLQKMQLPFKKTRSRIRQFKRLSSFYSLYGI